MLRSSILLLMVVLLGASLSFSDAFKTKKAAMLEQLTRPQAKLQAGRSGESMCVCPEGCIGATDLDDSVDDTFYVHCRLGGVNGEGNACSDDDACQIACQNCCSVYGFKELKGEAKCAENIGQCLTGIPPKCPYI